jgi:quercetin dioxygenase-like cupin family protein
MGTFRMYAGSDGQAHVETIDIDARPDWLKGLPATQISFRTWKVGEFMDWHPAPRRQFVIILSGQLEIGFGDGSKRRFGPGDARLVEDTTGQGHTTRTIGDQPCITATVPLAQQ